MHRRDFAVDRGVHIWKGFEKLEVEYLFAQIRPCIMCVATTSFLTTSCVVVRIVRGALAVICRVALRLTVYLDETMLIPKNTSVIIKRLPKPGQVNLLARLANNAPFSAAMMYGDGYRRCTLVIQMKSVQRTIKYVEIGARRDVVCSLLSVCREDLINQWCWNWAAGAPILESVFPMWGEPAVHASRCSLSKM